MFSTWTRRAVSVRASQCMASRAANTVRHASTKEPKKAAAQSVTKVAYEEALKLIELDKKERLEMLGRVEKEIARVKKAESPTQAAQLAALEALKFDLQVKSELNDPEVQRNFKLGIVDMSRPVYRYMRQKQFEKAPLATLMERITQMRVIPDLLPLDTKPVIDVGIRVNGKSEAIEPGVFTKPEETIQLPDINVTSFHPETRLYTFFLVDPDSPDVANKTYQQHCHWIQTNVPLSATQSQVTGGDTVLEYVPPHPQKGTKYHRYTLIAYEQPNNGQDKVDIKVEKREGFNARALAQQYSLQVRGVSFFRQVWDETVSMIYKDILRTHEPIYGKPPRQEPYIRRAVYL